MPFRASIVLFVVGLLLAGAVRADRVFLRNGRVLEGVIEAEDEERVILRMVGTRLTLDQNRVERVERAGEEARQALVADLLKAELPPPPFPDALNPLRTEVDRLFAERQLALAAAEGLRRIEADEPRLQRERQAAFSRYFQLQDELAKLAGRRRGTTYSETLAAVQEVAAEINRLDAELDALVQHRGVWQERVSAYPTLLATVWANVEQMRGSFEEEMEDGPGTAWLHDVGNRLAGLEGDFATVRVPLRQDGRRTIVSARLNDQVEATLLLDTGASVVTISKAIAQRLGLSYDPAAPLQVTLADGSQSAGYPVVLRSVAVGEARLEDVQAVVLARPPAPDLDGLLGMSFLKAFSMTHDGASNRLELRRFLPEGR